MLLVFRVVSLAIQPQVSNLSSHVTTWGDEKDGENDLVLLSPGTASCLALVRGSLLQDYKWGICLTKYWKYYLWLNDVLGPDPIYCSGLHFTPWVLSSLRLSSYIPSKYLYNPVLGDVTMTRVSYWWLTTTICLLNIKVGYHHNLVHLASNLGMASPCDWWWITRRQIVTQSSSCLRCSAIQKLCPIL